MIISRYACLMPSTPVVLAEKKIIGIAVRTTNQHESDPRTARIPSLWQRFVSEGIEQQIPGRLRPGLLIGTYTDYETDHNGPYTLIVSTEVDSLSAIPDRMIGTTIPAGTYLVFEGEGDLQQAVPETWRRAWTYFGQKQPYERTYTADFEQYTAPDRVEIYISVRKRSAG